MKNPDCLSLIQFFLNNALIYLDLLCKTFSYCDQEYDMRNCAVIDLQTNDAGRKPQDRHDGNALFSYFIEQQV